MRCALIFILSMLAGEPATLLAQAETGTDTIDASVARLAAGAHVRVWADRPPLRKREAVFVRASADSVFMRTTTFGSVPLTLSRPSLTRLDVGVPRSRLAGAGNGFLKGLLVAAVVDGVIGAAWILHERRENKAPESGMEYPIAMMFATPAIVGVSTFLGAVSPGSGWKTLYRR